MRKAFVNLFLALCLACGLMPAGWAWGASSSEDSTGASESPTETNTLEGDYASDDIIVVYDDADDGTIRALSTYQVEENLNDAGVQVEETLVDASEDLGTMVLASVPEGQDVASAIEAAEQVEGVAYAQPDYVYTLLEDDVDSSDAEAALEDEASTEGSMETEAVTNDPATQVYDTSVTANQYYLYGDEGSVKGADVIDAWDYVTCEDETVTIVVLDTGVNLTHEDLKDNLLTEYCYDFYNDEPLEATVSFNGDYYGHGTHVAGIAAATANNGTGIAGASYNANVIAYKVFNDATVSSDVSAQTSDIVQALGEMIDLAEEHPELNIHVANMSLGSYSSDSSTRNLIRQAREANILAVCAGGNGDSSGNPYTKNQYPSDYEESLAVTALQADGTNATWSDFNEEKDISAPGVALYSTYVTNDSSYARMSGTSMASPLVAGIAALLWAADPSATVDEVVEAITSTATEVDDSNDSYRRNSTGYGGVVSGSAGAINAEAAVLAMSNAHITVPDGFDTMSLTQTVQLGVDLSDAAADNAEDLEWEWSVVEGGTGSATITDTGLLTATGVGTVTVSVKATGLADGREYSAQRNIVIDEIALPSGGGPWASVGYADAVTVQWLAADVATGYYVQRAEDGTDAYATIATVESTAEAGTMLAYEDYTAADAVTYQYRIVPYGTLDGVIYEGTASDSASGVRLNMVSTLGSQSDIVTYIQTLLGIDGKSIDTVMVVSEDDAPTALVASGLAGVYGAAIVTVSDEGLSADAAAALTAYNPVRVLVVGDEDAISDSTMDGIQSAASRATVARYAGTTTNATAEQLYKLGRGYWGSTAFIVSGDAESTGEEALSLGAYAYAADGPVFATNASGSLSVTTRQNLSAGSFTRVVIVGDEDAVGTNVEEQLAKMGITYERIQGDTAYAVSAALAEDGLSAGVLNGDVNYFASADLGTCLAAATLAGYNGCPLLVIDDDAEDVLASCVEQGTEDDYTPVVYFSGEGLSVISDAEQERILGFVQGDTSIVPVIAADGTSIRGAEIAAIADQTYTGEAITPSVTVTLDGVQLVAGTDYTVSYSNNVEVGTATVTVTGTGSYSGTARATFNIVAAPEPVSIEGAEIAAIADQTYTGSAITPDVTVTLDGVQLVAGTDYTVSYADNVEVGTATVTVTGTGSYTGTATSTFNIVAAPAKTFSDVEEGSWYADGVATVVELGLMRGYDDSDAFGVGRGLTRAELAVIMWRAVEPEAEAAYVAEGTANETGMADVAAGTWYTGAANWAVEAGVINGKENADGSRSFDPDATVTFEEMVSVLANYAASPNALASANTTVLSRFVDGGSVSSWARSTVSWAVIAELVNGYDRADGRYLVPQENVTRERAAAVLANAIDNDIL